MSTSGDSGSEIAGLNDLLPVLARTGVFTERELDDIRGKVLEGAYPSEPTALATRLVQAKLLTDFQARRCLLNRPEGLVLGRYLILDRIGSGGMGRVYKAKHMMMGRVVALKIIPMRLSGSGTKVARFRREMQIVGRLDHPNVVRAFDADQVGDLLYIAMEYVDGRSLEQVLRERRRLSVVESVFYVMQAAAALEHAHEQGVIHRDVKPSNLLLIGSKTVKLLDLGLGAFVEREEFDDFKTEAGITVGTMAYLSPEQACSKPVDGRSDIYSLGCVLYHLIAGRLPFPGDSSMERLAVRITGQTTPITDILPDIHPRVAHILGKMLAHQPDDRYQTAGEVAAALKALIRPKGAAAPVPTPSSTVSPVSVPKLMPTPTPAREPVTEPDHAPLLSQVVATTPATRAPRRRAGLMVGSAAALLVIGVTIWIMKSGAMQASVAQSNRGAPEPTLAKPAAQIVGQPTP